MEHLIVFYIDRLSKQSFTLKDTIRHGYLKAYDSFVSSNMAKTI